MRPGALGDDVLALASLIFLALIVAAVVAVGALILRVAFWAILLPFKIVFGLLFLPFWIGKTLLRLAFGVVLVPVLLVGGILVAFVAAIAAIVAIITPLLPFAIVAFLIWMVFRSFGRPVAA
jgi:hypothetical protein